ncbi:protein YAE1 homolog [Tiliqua scincoides]|uniref:protein YAE1 homolog n=1 Tax=Tiliqua scincoides TaxID=71010 RepID=UPI003461C128
MSWVRSVLSQPAEDVFDEDADEMAVAQKEWRSAMEKRVKEGYREGVEAGKELTLQQGFNQGYKEAAKLMFSCGQLKGTISALLSWCHHNGCDPAVLNKMTELLNEVGKYEECVLKSLNSTHLQPHIGDILNTIEDMDLGPVFSPEQCNGTTDGNISETDIEFNRQCCKNNRTDSFQSEYCRRTEETDSKRPTFALLKEKVVSLVAQLGLSVDTLEHIQLL